MQMDGGVLWLDPTWENQIKMARQLLTDKGTQELYRHALVSYRHGCRCNDCFCCAARQVYEEATKRERD